MSGLSYLGKPLWRNSDPSQRFHRQPRVPDLCHMADLVAVKIHHVHIVRLHAFAGWWARAALAGVGAGEDAVGTNTLALVVGGKRPQLVSSIRDEGQDCLHPVCVLLQSTQVGERFGLRRERGIGLAVSLAPV